MARKPAIDIEEKQSPEERLRFESNLERDFQAAKVLLSQKRYKEALREFKSVFSQPNVAEFSFDLPEAEIRQLIKHHPPAERMIRRWRNDKEKLILSGLTDNALFHDWKTLNACLKEKNRVEAVFYKLPRIPENEEAIESILWEIWPKLAKARKYDQIGKFLRTLAWLVFLHVNEFESESLFPCGSSKSKDRPELRRSLDEIVGNDPLVFEVALGLEELDIASHICKKILSVEASDRTYGKLIDGAIRARNYDEAQRLFSEARVRLKRCPICRQSVLKVPKSQAHRFK